jgi:hypothetical protein
MLLSALLSGGETCNYFGRTNPQLWRELLGHYVSGADAPRYD